MTRGVLIPIATALALAASGCGGSGGADGGAGAEAGGCEEAVAELVATVSERDRLFVDLRLDEAAKACVDEYEPGSDTECAQARADLGAAAAEDTPPANVEERAQAAVEACVGATITSTLPPP